MQVKKDASYKIQQKTGNSGETIRQKQKNEPNKDSSCYGIDGWNEIK